MIDFSRAFRTQETLLKPQNLVRCDRKLLARMRALDQNALQSKLKPYLTDTEIAALLVRREKIVKLFDEQIARNGEAAVLFDLPRSGQVCGVGL